MKRILVLLLGILIFSCTQEKKTEKKTTNKQEVITTENFDWLLGNWKRLHEEKGKETFENWQKINKTTYSGVGFTMQNGDTIKRENMQLLKVDKHWNLIVSVLDESEAVTFTGTSHSQSEFVCENTTLDFPNKISYWKKGDRLNATVSGTDLKIDFVFEKIKQQQ